MATQLDQHLAKMKIFPQIVQVETLNLCNARCSFCLQPGMRRARGRMADSLIEEIIRQVDRADSVLPFLLGEPLLDERLVDILTRVKERSPEVGTCIYTNGSLLNEKRGEEILRSRALDLLCISFYGPDRETFNRLQPPLDYDVVACNVLNFARIKDLLPASGFGTPLTFTGMAGPFLAARTTKAKRYWAT